MTRRTGSTAAIGVAAALAALAAQGRPVLLLVLAGALLAVVMAARPEAAALTAIALTFSNATVIAVHDHGFPGAVSLVVPILLLVTAGHHVFAERLPVLVPRAAIWGVALLLAQGASALASRDPVVSVATVQTPAIEGGALFLLIVNAVRGWELVRLAALVLVVVAGLLGALTLVQEVSGSNHRELGGFATMSRAVINRSNTGGSPRHAGPIGEQNRWAQSLAVVLPLAVALGVADRSRSARTLARVGGAGIAVGIVLTYSRGAVVGLLLAAVVAALLRWIRVRTVALAGAAVVVGLLAFAPVFADRAGTVVSARGSVLSGSGTSEQQDGSFSNRATEATAAIATFVHHPVLGVGPGLFPTYFQDEARSQGADRIVGVEREAHSLYLGLAAETGVLGLATFLALIGSLLIPLTRVRRHHLGRQDDVAALATGFALSLITYLATGLFLHLAYMRYLWLVAALAAAMGMVPDPAPTERPHPVPAHASGPSVPDHPPPASEAP